MSHPIRQNSVNPSQKKANQVESDTSEASTRRPLTNQELNNEYMSIILSNMIRNNDLKIADKKTREIYLLSDEEYDKKVKRINAGHLQENVPQEEFIIYSLPKYKTCKLPFPLLVSMKIDGACICLRFVNDERDNIELVNVYTKNYNNLKNKESLEHLLTKLKPHPDTHAIITKLKNADIPFTEVMVRVELFGVDCNDVGPANYASAAISCDVSKFSSYHVQMKVVEVPYIMKIHKVPVQQERVFAIFGEMSVPNRIVNNEQEFKDALCEYITQEEIPCDGLVYSKASWTYPVLTDMSKAMANKSVNYDKYAMKTYDMYQTEVTKEPEYSSSIDGQISCTIEYRQVDVNGKKYMKGRFPVSKFGTIGIGSQLELEFSSNAFPQIKEVLTPADIPFEIPVKCMFCNTSLDQTKDGVIYCRNPDCSEVHVLLMTKLLGYYMKGIGDKTVRAIRGNPITLSLVMKHLSSKKQFNKKFIENVLDTPLVNLIKHLGYVSETMFAKLAAEESKGVGFNKLTVREALIAHEKNPDSLIHAINTKTQSSKVKRTPGKQKFILNLLTFLLDKVE